MTGTTRVTNWGEALQAGAYDALVVVSPTGGLREVPPVEAALGPYRAAVADWESQVCLVLARDVPGGRIVLAPTGPLDRDYDDVRRFGDAARAGLRRARDAGARRPLLALDGVPAEACFGHALDVALLEGLGGLWEPLEAREARGDGVEPVEQLGLLSADSRSSAALRRAVVLEQARRVTRDVAGTEPERMSPERVAELWGDPFEVTRSRREDFAFVRARSRADDVLSCNKEPSVNTPRGHQFPMAFLTIASGLDRHGASSRQPLPYVHLDISGSAFEGGDWQHGRPTATPVLTLSAWMGLTEA
jgi:hypothetical protein